MYYSTSRVVNITYNQQIHRAGVSDNREETGIALAMACTVNSYTVISMTLPNYVHVHVYTYSSSGYFV